MNRTFLIWCYCTVERSIQKRCDGYRKNAQRFKQQQYEQKIISDKFKYRRLHQRWKSFY